MKHIHLLFIALLFLAGTAKAQMTPIEFNDNLASITDSLYARGQAWGTAFNEAYKNGNYSALKPYSSGMLAFIDKKIIYVKGLKDINDSKPMRMAMLDLLAFEKKMITESFIPFESFNSSTPQEKILEAYKVLKAKSEDEADYLKKVGTAQDAYAAQNGFKMEPPAAETASDQKN